MNCIRTQQWRPTRLWFICRWLTPAIASVAIGLAAQWTARAQSLTNPAAQLAGSSTATSAQATNVTGIPSGEAEAVTPAPVLDEALAEPTWDAGTAHDIQCAAQVESAGLESPRRSQWFGSVELTMLHASSVNSSATTLEDDNGLGTRFIVGWESAAGLGLRARFWDYLVEAERPGSLYPYGPMRLELDASRFDFDIYRRFSLSHGSISVGGSVSSATISFRRDDTYASFNNPFPPFIFTMPDYETRHIGGGVGFFVEGRHRFYESPKHELSVLARGRWTGLIGETSDTRIGYEISNSNINIAEAALGLEYRRKFRVADFLLQCNLEGQAWAIGGVPAGYFNYLYDPTPPNVNFLGPSVMVGLSR